MIEHGLIPARPRRVMACALAAVAAQVAMAAMTNLDKLAAPAADRPVKVEDTDLYHRYATMALVGGRVPYRDFAVEYPPLSLPLFLLPRLVAADLRGYKLAFAAEMLLFNAATVLLVARRVGLHEGEDRVAARLGWYTLYLLILSRFLVSRYDAAPMFLGFLASTAWAPGRGGLGGLAASLGAMTKGYPALVAALGSARDLSGPGAGRWRGLAAFALASALGGLAWLALAGPGGLRRSLEYHGGRGFEYGSVYSGAQMLAAKAAGAEVAISRDHASFSSITPWTPGLLAMATPIQVAALLAVGVATLRRGGGEDLVRPSAAAVLAFVVSGKVFSPQYLLWLVPFVAALGGPIGPRARRIFAAGCAATLLAPSALNFLPRTSLWVILGFNLKNALFLWLLAVLVLGRAGGGGGRRDSEA